MSAITRRSDFDLLLRRTPDDPAPPAAATAAEPPVHETFGHLARSYAAQAGSIPGDAGNMVRDATTAITGITGHIRDALAHADAIAGNHLASPDRRKAVIREIGGNLAARAADDLGRAANLVTIASAALETAAMPVVPKGSETTARQDAEMLLRNVDARDLAGRMRQLAAREDPIGALIASPWGADYLASRGEDPGFHGIARAGALEAARNSTNTKRAAAAAALDRLRHLEGAITAAHQQVRHATGDDLKKIIGSIR